MEYLKGSVCQRFQQLWQAHWEQNTDLNKVFELILRTAVEWKVAKEDLPNSIIIISDMEFDEALNGGYRSTRNVTNYEGAKQLFNRYGYELPNIIFWNVNWREGNNPVSYDTQGTALVSGASPAIVKNLLSGKDMTPIAVMKEALLSERYEKIS